MKDNDPQITNFENYSILFQFSIFVINDIWLRGLVAIFSGNMQISGHCKKTPKLLQITFHPILTFPNQTLNNKSEIVKD